jgi:uncharacterized protein YndB with AHSA1/START domain
MSNRPKFVYVIYIRTTPEKLWRALTEPELTRQYWAGTWQESDWQVGAAWRIVMPDGRIADTGEIVEIEPCRRLVLTWRNEFRPELHAECYSRLTYALELQGDMVKLTVTHDIAKLASKFIEAVSNGWPAILSSLKSLLETGEPLEATRRWKEPADSHARN